MNKRLAVSSVVVLGAVLFAVVLSSRREAATASSPKSAVSDRQTTAQTDGGSTAKPPPAGSSHPTEATKVEAQAVAPVVPAPTAAGQIASAPVTGPAATPRAALAERKTGAMPTSTAAPAASEPMAFPGMPVTARVVAGERAFELVPDQVGTLQLHEPLPLKSAFQIEVAYPTGDDNARVVAVVEDGGQLADGKRVLPLQLDANRKVSFRFSTTDAQGIYRITLRCGVDVKTIQLWGGDPLPVAGS